MRKKWLTMGAGLSVGAALFFVSGLSAMANTSGYEAYKTAVKNTKAETSLTAKVDVSLSDNGTKLLAGSANVKLNQAQNAGSVAANVSSGAQSFGLNVYRQDGKLIFKTSDNEIYRVKDQPASQKQFKGGQANLPKAAEQIIDTLMGNLRELATVENKADGSQQASLHLSGSQIPAVVNAIGTLIVSNAGECSGDSGKWGGPDRAPFPHPNLKPNVPKLTDNIQVDKIDLDAAISPKQILEQQTAEISVSGSDDAGKKHVLTLRLNVDFSGFDQTAPDKIDLQGKQTEAIKNDSFKRGWRE